jgi:hypothetical protein
MNNRSTGLPGQRQQSSASSRPASQTFVQLNELYDSCQTKFTTAVPIVGVPLPTAQTWPHANHLGSSGPIGQQPIIDYFERGFNNSLATQRSPESFTYCGLNQPIRVAGVQDREQAADSQRLDAIMNHGPMGHDQATVVPAPQASLAPTATPVEMNLDNSSIT